MKSDNHRDNRGGSKYERRPYGENRFDGPGRRVYGDGPRVGRVAGNVPPARRADGDAAAEDVPRGAYRGNVDFRRGGEARDGRRGGPRPDEVRDIYHGGAPRRDALHRGGAWRSESGPAKPRRYDREPAAAEPEIPLDEERLLAGRNPIREALKAGRPVEKLLVAAGDLSGAAREIIRMARDAGAVVQEVDRSRLDQIYPAHQGMLAYVAAAAYTELTDLLAAAQASDEDPFIVILDGVTDPHNLGAIIRSAECAGAHGVVLPERRAAGLTPAAAKAAAGALSHMPVARVKNLNRAIDAMKAAGLWIIGTAMEGEDAFSADLTGPVALVIGSEGDGVSRLTLEKCDRAVSLPMKGHIESLNASVAAGILMYEIVRQRNL